jgi:hypothetical protein
MGNSDSKKRRLQRLILTDLPSKATVLKSESSFKDGAKATQKLFDSGSSLFRLDTNPQFALFY